MSNSTPTLHSITVKFRIDDYPEQTANIKYRVFETETEIIFPKGEKRTFKNWDVRNLRESYFREEIMQQHNADESIRSKAELVEHGVRLCDVQAFISKLAANPRYENFFELDFTQPEPVVVTKAPATPPSTPKAKAPARKFPYAEVARLWAEGRTTKEIAIAIDRIDHDNPKDPTHTVRTFLTKMHRGYPDSNGNIVKLPYRAKKAVAGA
jgi:hypothetical protein